MKKTLLGLAVIALSASVAAATPNPTNVVFNLRVFNDCPTTTLETYNNYPSEIWIDDQNNDCFGYANLHNWHLSEDGELRPLLQSRGLSCNADHNHHPYWRFEFDIDGSGMDQVFVHDDGGPDTGWGPGWTKYTNERNDVKNSATHRAWFVRDQLNGHGVWVLPGSGYPPLTSDGDRDRFADHDVAIRRAKATEDLPWVFGARGQFGYDEDNQGVQEQDIVFWYVGHLPHMAVLGPTKWLTLGPTLRIQR